MIPLRDNAPTRQFPLVTVALIVANVLVYVLVQDAAFTAPQGPVDELAFHPCEVNESCRVVGEGWALTAFTSMFMHADLVHLGGNMLFLWIFGNNVEDALGRFRFLAFYLLGGLAATGLQTIVTLSTATPAAAEIPNLGASGAISAVLGGYFVLLPQARVLTLIFVVVIFFVQEIPAFVFLLFYFLFQAWEANFQLQHPPEGGGVAVFAHLGGFAFGFIAVKLFQVRRPLQPRW
ncbi:MAG TPA: rhomboid family intramembrane serine protease [Gaiellaceae bacterium]|nr:rhomboid family intramembrane serine protease [Gaiellaceae bacterium]